MEAKEKQSINPRMLKTVRERTGLSQTEIGSVLGCHRTAISRIERGVETPDWLVKFIQLSRLLDKAGLTWEDVIMDLPEVATLRAAESSSEYQISKM